MNKVAESIIIESYEKEIKDQYIILLILGGSFCAGSIFFFSYSASLIEPLTYLGLFFSYMAFARYYKMNPSFHEQILIYVFRFYCVHTSGEIFYGLWPELFPEEKAKEEVKEMGKGLVLIIILISIKYGYLALRIGLAIHFYRVLRLMGKVEKMKEKLKESGT